MAYDETLAPKELGVYLRFYNDQRRHQALGYSTPAEVFYDESPLRNEASKGRRCSPDPVLESWQERQDSHLTRPHQLGYVKTPGVWVGKILRRCFTGQLNPDQLRRTAIAENYRPRVGLVVLALVRTLGSLKYRDVRHLVLTIGRGLSFQNRCQIDLGTILNDFLGGFLLACPRGARALRR